MLLSMTRYGLGTIHKTSFTNAHTGQADGNPDVQLGRCERFLIPYDTVLVWLNDLCTAISDAVRTSLGPRGMDKMVFYRNVFILVNADVQSGLDSNSKRRSHHHE